ncbi:hypothetical protein Tco_1294588 [Tanacetum coccineum]
MESKFLLGDETLTDLRTKISRERPTKRTSTTAIDRNKVIIEDWVVSDDEEPDVQKVKRKLLLTKRIVKHLVNTGHQTTKQCWSRILDKRLGNKGLLTIIKRFLITRTPHRPHRPEKLLNLLVKKGSTVGSHAGQSEEDLRSLLSLTVDALDFVDEDMVILRAPRKNDVYSLDLKNIIPSGGITCLVAKATEDEAVLWHRRLGLSNFKNINIKGKQHRAILQDRLKKELSENSWLATYDLFGLFSGECNRRTVLLGGH